MVIRTRQLRSDAQGARHTALIASLLGMLDSAG